MCTDGFRDRPRALPGLPAALGSTQVPASASNYPDPGVGQQIPRPRRQPAIAGSPVAVNHCSGTGGARMAAHPVNIDNLVAAVLDGCRGFAE